MNFDDVGIGLHWFALLYMNFVTALGLLFTWDGDSNCFTIFIILNLCIMWDWNIILPNWDHTDAVVRSVGRQKISFFYS